MHMKDKALPARAAPPAGAVAARRRIAAALRAREEARFAAQRDRQQRWRAVTKRVRLRVSKRVERAVVERVATFRFDQPRPRQMKVEGMDFAGAVVAYRMKEARQSE